MSREFRPYHVYRKNHESLHETGCRFADKEEAKQQARRFAAAWPGFKYCVVTIPFTIVRHTVETEEDE